MKEEKKQRLLLIVSQIRAGKKPAKISKEQKINKKTLQNHLRQLKEMGCIEKQGYGVWKVLKEVSISSKATSLQKQIRGHAFNWKIKFKNNIDWERRLKKYKIKYQLIGINRSTPRIIFNGKKIWLTKTGLIIYEPNSFFAISSYTSKGMAVWELNKTIKALGRALRISLEGYRFATSREHYGMIKNELARQYNNKGEKLYIVDDEGKWMCIDFSHGIHELETNKPDTSRGVQNWYNDMKKTNFEVTPTFVLEGMDKIKTNLELMQQSISNINQENTIPKQSQPLQKNIRDVQPPSYIQ